ncbi:hypothetical protein QFC22_003822 [Naganishia vaughanmartiniae]|uniref:Uncharacterized protein n=1 Tax=Naganishia vaughanmartiniae TaxID=1424756 RepID=A0ACC2X5N3_9TREE|nr:hypothetical protein QFC22_003822 [Naganishia vaughanmartiniae]
MDDFGLPMSFGKKAAPKRNNVRGKVEQTKRADATPAVEETTARKRPHSDITTEDVPGPTPAETIKQESGTEPNVPAPVARNSKGIVDDAEDDDDDDEDDGSGALEEQDMPVSHEIILKDHSKAITALAIDSSGARVATGAHDYDVKLWDFGGMDGRLKPFATFEPNGSYPVHHVEFSPDSKSLLVISGTHQPKLYTRDGEDGVAFNKGDPYIRDMRHTKGHVADITSGAWNPTSSTEFITASNDSTIRIWDATVRTAHKSVIVVRSKERGARTKVTACAFSADGKTIAGACEDGTVHIWDARGNLARPSRSCETAHEKGVGAVSGMAFSRDGTHLVTRGGDDTVKLWDTRSLRKPLFTASFLPNAYPETNIIFSPDDKTILTGLSVQKDSAAKGEIVVLNREDLTEKKRIPVSEGSVIKVAWHSRINQLLATTSLGSCHVLYSPTSSIHGALLPLAKMPRQKARDQVYTSDLPPVIMTPHALPMFRDEDYRQTKRKKEKERADPVKSHKPQEPLKGAGRGGRVGASATQHLVQHMFRNTMRDEDPREALLKYADKEGTDPVYTKAWQQNQPNPVFDNRGATTDKKDDESKE